MGKKLLGKLRSSLTSAIRFWEPMRIVYNLLLLAVVLNAAEGSWSDLHHTLLPLFLLAMAANVLYSFAYVPDLMLQFSDFEKAKPYFRGVLFTLGTATAGAIAWSCCHFGFFPLC